MTRRRIVASRAEAQRLIERRMVTVQGVPTPKPSTLVREDTPISVPDPEKKWVSRAAHKLQAALEAFPVDPHGSDVLDVGASTGGFTQLLLEAGARSVVALDVGRGQLHETLRSDTRVISLERTNLRHVGPGDLGRTFPLITGDLSFISLCAVAPNLAMLAAEEADLILLVKPQFEVGKGRVGRGGVVTDAEQRAGAVHRVMRCLHNAGLGSMGVIRSPIEGADGNVEYLLWLRKGAGQPDLEVPG